MARRAMDLSTELIDFCYLPKPKSDAPQKHRPKAGARRMLGILTTASVAGALVALGMFTAAGSWASKTFASVFCVRQILVEGMGDLDAEKLSRSCVSILGRSLFSVSTQDVNCSLESIPTVRRASVVKRYPDTLVIKISQRKPVLRIEVDDRIRGVSEDGVILPLPKTHDFKGLPLAKGLDVSGTKPGARVKNDFFPQLLDMCESISCSAAGKLQAGSVIEAVDGMEVRVKLQKGRPVLIFSLDDARRQLEKYLHVMPLLSPKVDECASLDLRFKGQIIIKEVLS